MPQPASTAHASMGAKIEVKISGTFTEIYECYNTDGPERNWDLADTTTLGSPGKAEELLPTIKRTGEVSWSMNHLPADTTHQYLETANGAATREDFRITASDAGAETVTFTAYVRQFRRVKVANDAEKINVTLKLTGDYTVTP